MNEGSRELKKYYIVRLLNIKNQLWFYHEAIAESKLEYIIIDHQVKKTTFYQSLNWIVVLFLLITSMA